MLSFTTKVTVLKGPPIPRAIKLSHKKTFNSHTVDLFDQQWVYKNHMNAMQKTLHEKKSY